MGEVRPETTLRLFFATNSTKSLVRRIGRTTPRHEGQRLRAHRSSRSSRSGRAAAGPGRPPRDRLFLTPAGEILLTETLPTHLAIIEEMLGGLRGSELKMLHDQLEHVADRAEVTGTD